MVTKNAAIIVVPRDYLAKLLDFEGGKILRISERPEYYNPKDIELLIEHPDLPEVEDGHLLPMIEPMYQSTIRVIQADEENEEAETFEKIERIEPPKKEIADASL